MSYVTHMAEACLPHIPSAVAVLPWYAVRVREKYRATTTEKLAAQGIEYFSPFTTELRQWSDRRKLVSIPLFAGYLFCRFDSERQSHLVVRTLGVIDIVRCGARFAEVDPVELEAVRRAIDACPRVEEWAHLVSGQRVRVRCGAMSGVEGVLLEVKSQARLVLSVTMMNRSVAVEIDRSLVDPI